MKKIFLSFVFLTIGSVYCEDGNNLNKSNLITELKVDKSPCEKNPEEQACKDFLKDAMSEYPCANDFLKYCAPKDHNSADIVKNINLDDMDKCLEKNMFKLSTACKKVTEIRIGQKECLDRAASRCTGLKPDKEIDCMANVYSKENSSCK